MSTVGSPDETKCIYYIDEEETPYLVKLNVPPENVTLGDFKAAINRIHSKFFFKSIDDDFGVVKEELFDDDAKLPCFNGRVISWLVTNDGGSSSVTLSDSAATDSVDRQPQQQLHLNSGATSVVAAESAGHRLLSTTNASSPATAVACPGTVATPANLPTSSPIVDSTSTPSNDPGGDPETDSVNSTGQDCIAPLRSFQDYKTGGGGRLTTNSSATPANRSRLQPSQPHMTSIRNAGAYEAPSSMMSSDLESTSFFDSEDDSSRFSSVTGTTWSSRRYARQTRQRQKRRRRPPPISRASSLSSITDSTLSLNIVAVTLNLDSTVNFLGISIVGQSNKAGDGGIYVGSIMKGGAVAQDGRIEPGDMILEVNGISFEQLTNDDAVRTLREQVQRPGPITLVVAKCWDPNPRSTSNAAPYFTIPRQEPVRPIDPRAWVLHTNAMTANTPAPNNDQPQPVKVPTVAGNPNLLMHHQQQRKPIAGGTQQQRLLPHAASYNLMAVTNRQQQQALPGQHQLMLAQHQQALAGGGQPPYMHPHHQMAPSVVTSSSLPEIERYSAEPLTVGTDLVIVIRSMLQPDSGLDIRDRSWLKLTIPSAFIGSDLVDWLFRHLDGFTDRRSARKYASNMLQLGYIRHTVNKTTFSEQCYYVFRDIVSHLSTMSLEEGEDLEPVDSVSEIGALQHQQQRLQTLKMTGGWDHRQQPMLAAPIRQLIADGQDLAANQPLHAARTTGVSLQPRLPGETVPSKALSSSSSSSDDDDQGGAFNLHCQQPLQLPSDSNPPVGGGRANDSCSSSSSSEASLTADRFQHPPNPPPRHSTTTTTSPTAVNCSMLPLPNR